jgi:hypothetical protein
MAVRQGLPGSLAARVTYLLEPKNWLIVTVVGIGAHADGLAGAAWGLLAAFFAAVLPTVFISYGHPARPVGGQERGGRGGPGSSCSGSSRHRSRPG